MSTTSETGHAKNAANLEELISYILTYAGAYNPSKTALQTEPLQALAGNAKTAVKAVNALYPAYSKAIADREKAFAPLSKLATRLVNAVKATDTSEKEIENIKTLVRKIQGTRATAKLTEEEKQAFAAEGKEVKEISASQTSFDNRLNNFDKLVNLLANNPLYTPNEPELQPPTLAALYNELDTTNRAAINATAPLSSARIARNEILYTPGNGLVDIASDVKSYIKSVFGAGSPQYKQISNIVFTKVKP